ncbi:unnamed protein product [Lactuca saligna]|uniref:Uncharacterized protein n=1 Tax=Lactuca saligna TaxID=75948 RepID=A0AA35Y9V5_LACSI|nr:unnamed protein product [Lactuca saligna]
MQRLWGIVYQDYFGHVVLESNAVKRYGIRATPVDLEENLEPGKIYFLVELPKLPKTAEKTLTIRRVRWRKSSRLENAAVTTAVEGRQAEVAYRRWSEREEEATVGEKED